MCQACKTCLLFPSKLGWMAVVLVGGKVARLTFGRKTAVAARAAIGCSKDVFHRRKHHPLIRRLQAFAQGTPDSFADVVVELQSLTPFEQQVLKACRAVSYGRTISYSALAAAVGRPRAARAVSNALAKNPIPLIIPCHRVVSSAGRLGRYSAPGGQAMKRFLLRLEAKNRSRLE